MSHGVQYCVKQLGKLIDGRIHRVFQSDDGRSFGIRVVTLDGRPYDVWIDQDAEGNGPGWAVPEEASAFVLKG
jgi:hypothetical protein